MTNSANKIILDRELSDTLREKYDPYLSLMREIVNYGTDMILRCYEFSPKTDIDGILIGHFLKRSVMLLDTIEILLSNASFSGAEPIARVLFENLILTKWTLKENTDTRARQLIVSNLRQQRAWVERVVPETDEYKYFNEAISIIGENQVRDEFPVVEAEERINHINSILSKNIYHSINEQFNIAKNKIGWDPDWYKLEDEKFSIRNIATKQLDLKPQFQIFYTTLSQAVHGTNSFKSITYEGGLLKHKPVRSDNYRDYCTLILFCISNTFDIYELMLERYRPEEMVNYRQIYGLEWRERYNKLRYCQ